MPQWGPISRRRFVYALRSLGFSTPTPGGNHQVMERDGVRVRVPNPHRGDIDVELLARILRIAGISREEWESVP